MTAPLLPADRAPADEGAIDAAVLNELRILGQGAGKDFLAELVNQFAHQTEPLLAQLGEAFEHDDAPAVSRIVHSIKGSSSVLGGRRLASSCDRVEAKATSRCLSDWQSDLHDLSSDYEELCRILRQQLSSTDEERPGLPHA